MKKVRENLGERRIEDGNEKKNGRGMIEEH